MSNRSFQHGRDFLARLLLDRAQAKGLPPAPLPRHNRRMNNIITTYGPLGPLGFPLSEMQARNLDILLKALPKSKEFEYRKTVFLNAPTEVNPGERSDAS